MERGLSSESDLVTYSASFRARTDPRVLRASSDTRDAVATNSSSPSSSSSSLSSFAAFKSPLASNPADVTPAPWCAPQARATIAPVSRVSCTSCSTPRPSVHTRGSYASPDIWPFSGLFPHTLRMFSVSLFRLRLAPFFSFPLVSFAIKLRPLPLLSTSCPLSRLDITSTAIFILNTGLVSHTTRPNFSPFVCVRFRATVAQSPTCLLPRSRFLVSLAVRSDFSYRYSSPSSANLCVPPPRCRLTLAFRSSRAHRPLITPARVLSSGTCPVLYFLCAPFKLTRGPPSAFQHSTYFLWVFDPS